ncbi:hypothetical protein KGG73_gp35 [Streptomyces phage Sentinel]|uniref:Uncharacterized protein n=1 Tax=Streptomyces phage Sentinel TaxID=2767584 RepID=A0A873WEF0_9CAUD|nr:hypothetical protein KGG73_gp35 [Streptomyces phage Sentinel]QPB09869.1 hypothetical protein CPT_Sentinel_035 [Streptomyces phage Sentinel]
MAETEQTEVEQKPKRGGRKPDPMTRILGDVRAAAQHLGDYSTKPVPEERARSHDGRAAAWGRQYAKDGAIDSLVLSLTFEALASLNPAEERYALSQLTAVALARIEQIDEAGK